VLDIGVNVRSPRVFLLLAGPIKDSRVNAKTKLCSTVIILLAN
jgi:hypothetical protein